MSKEEATTFEVTIEKLIYGGAGLARHQGKVVFVPYSVPGDQLLVRPIEIKKTFIRAIIQRILTPGTGRINPTCIHFEKCGGCDWQQLEYSQQVEAKRQILEEIFYHKLPETRDLPIHMRACKQPYAYRSRARIQVTGDGGKTVAGFFRSGSHIIEDVENCPLFRPSLNKALSALRQFRIKSTPNAAPLERDIACSEEEGTWAIEHTRVESPKALAASGSVEKKEVLLQRKIGEFSYSITASAFFQANDYIVPELVEHVIASAQDTGNRSALDLFSGAGLFSLPLARQFHSVVAVENSRQSCEFCTRNADHAGFKNLQTVCEDVAEWMKSESAHRIPQFDLVVLDPPRTGVEPSILDHLCKWGAQTIIYVSCDLQTLVRDLARISPHPYRIDSIEGFDMFPQTYHFETVVRLKKN
jgi:23S rRNA (uracil1939-C5)-methyltransferase